jgi:DNA-binding NarL/FixJ family response regulator
MPWTKMTYLFCYDDHRGFNEEVRKRFSDETRYKVESFHTKLEFVKHCKKEKENRYCKVALIVAPDAKEQFEMIDEMTQEIKRIDPKTGLILLVPVDKLEDLKKTVRFNIDAYIPRNANAILRIHNAVKKLISEHNIAIFRKRRNLSLYVLLGFLLLVALLIFITWLRLPQYF